MGRLTRNRCIPLALTAGNMAFWLCLRDLSGLFDRFPLLALVYQARLQFPAFLVLGATLAWALYACAGRMPWVKALSIGAGFVFFQQIYNLLLRQRIYVVNPWLELAGIGIGVVLTGWLLGRRGETREDEPRVSLDTISTYRIQLMGVAILWVLLLHASQMDLQCFFPLNVIARLGNSGVDIFLFVSGIGMVYSLGKSPSVLAFYKRRARRIYPEAAPLIGVYSLIGILLGQFGVSLLIANCLGFGFWISARGFNWYYSFILLLYAVAPLMYRLLREERTRYVWAFVMIAASMAFMVFVFDGLGLMRLLIALSRFPVFVVGMLAGFWLKEGRTLSRGEYRSLLPICVAFLLLAYALDLYELYPVLASMWLCYCITAPAMCLPLSRLFSRVKDGRLMRFLKWAGENSLSLYVLDIILIRLHTFVLPAQPVTNAQHALVAAGVVIVDFLIVLAIQGIKRMALSYRR